MIIITMIIVTVRLMSDGTLHHLALAVAPEVAGHAVEEPQGLFGGRYGII